MNLLSDHERLTLLRMLRVMFPHESFPDGPYERTAKAVIEAAAESPRTLAQLLQGLRDLDRLRGQPFVELDAGVSLTVLRGIQDAPFFTSVLGTASVKLYDDHEVWELLGYEGSSFDKGGYIDRGFDDLDWLPDPSVDRIPMLADLQQEVAS